MSKGPIRINLKDAAARTGRTKFELKSILDDPKDKRLTPCAPLPVPGKSTTELAFLLEELKRLCPGMDAPELLVPPEPEPQPVYEDEEDEPPPPPPYSISAAQWQALWRMDDAEYDRQVEAYCRADPRAREYFARKKKPSEVRNAMGRRPSAQSGQQPPPRPPPPPQPPPQPPPRSPLPAARVDNGARHGMVFAGVMLVGFFLSQVGSPLWNSTPPPAPVQPRPWPPAVQNYTPPAPPRPLPPPRDRLRDGSNALSASPFNTHKPFDPNHLPTMEWRHDEKTHMAVPIDPTDTDTKSATGPSCSLAPLAPAFQKNFYIDRKACVVRPRERANL